MTLEELYKLIEEARQGMRLDGVPFGRIFDKDVVERFAEAEKELTR